MATIEIKETDKAKEEEDSFDNFGEYDENDVDSYDEEIDEYSDSRGIYQKYGSTTVHLYTELRFARVLYKRACIGFEKDAPPDPILWLSQGKKLSENWTEFKVTQVGIAEHEDTPEKNKEIIKEVLKCATSVYMDLMASIYKIFNEDIDKIVSKR